ncbi:MAG: hypothetical protein FJ102_00690 [Deltaproteobacteria bacterium]|nr:hypothetical protein [Deltaproteobacteria bacterium]
MTLLVLSALAVEPFTSLYTRAAGNGFGVIVYDGDRLTQAWNHTYSQYDAYEYTDDILYDTYFGYTDLDGTGNWLSDPESVWTEDGTGVIGSKQVAGNLEFTQWAFMPMAYEGFGVAQVVRVRNPSASARVPAFQLASLHNWQAGGSETVATYAADLVVEEASDIALWFHAPGAADNTCEQVYDTVLAGRKLAGDCAFYASSIVPGFGWSVPSLGPGEEAWHGVFTTTDPTPDWSPLEAGARDWLVAELQGWAAFQSEASVPADLGSDETAVFRQQLAYLKMAQVREPGAAFGQIVASFPVAAPQDDFPHYWNITWVRDSAYSIVALARAGYGEEAANALRFLFQEGKAGGYSAYVNGQDYGVSVCRLYGDGTEWSDDDGTGPNVELDNWGLFLWALAEILAQGDETGLLGDVGARALDEVADPLQAMIVASNGLIAVDSSIWERHWSGQQDQYTYTSVMAVAGLRAAAEIALQLGDPRATGYLQSAEGIAAAVALELVDENGVLAASKGQLNSGDDYLDISAVEAYNFDVLDPLGSSFGPTLAAWDEVLRVESGVGYARNDDGSDYDNAEWAFADLRVATAMRRACATARAEELEDWITGQAMLNGRQIPELFIPETGEYAGPVPMVGFGAGLYVLAMQERAANSAFCPEPVDPVFDTPIEAVYTPACSCEDASDSGAAGVLLLGIAAWRRRRGCTSSGLDGPWRRFQVEAAERPGLRPQPAPPVPRATPSMGNGQNDQACV